MRIGIDARLFGLEHAGLGRYVLKLVENVLKSDKKNEYVLFLKSKYKNEFSGKKRVKVVECNIPIYGLSEQIALPFIFSKEKLDLLHVPHFNAPLFYPGKFILTVHDLIKHDSKGPETTTRSPWLYTIKRLGYLFLTKTIAYRAAAILAPSEFVKEDLVRRLGVSREKVTVTYEASSSGIKDIVLSKEEKNEVLSRYGLTQPFIVYTGSLYPHKNVDLLIDAVVLHNKRKELDLQLALICARSVFWQRTYEKIKSRGLGDIIKMLGFVDDEGLSKIYSLALALVHPSKIEGFGLTGLEAMGVGLPVISSSSSCLPEIYGQAALFFDPESVDDLVKKMEILIKDPSLREQLSEAGYLQARKYSWEKMGRETVSVYKKLLK
ncbi:MAG: mannosyltransferase B-like protein [Microgenomates group bacterium GW2011_GWC1_44_37]|uniref:Mannosyltransferase B-like protein n=1 Tax=Candidatus Collierbacteria bacterium GW2011_GWB2_44_22 TaxID=1618387 RepID=A0A0G1KX53_9BACT|nr:MAG: mannosyltransferase B-like protein [Candidatus Collierbacteria bacterium GW2011_GWA2_44_13]KKT48526.1 MAG: mannosyltransferase B-like protein [Candidatus Collierbacteria bacterium GW2011_GWB1_44_197]KKT52519.1 MAG: mannosyltransferase B-like protein [Candidatus Collierbacteria bacterium GW2011_GWB2_44_22]KKT62742.1 MAG: mannosyltransferase B-like protein [Candidatus Collierbacteria bacterium GW2011_GWD1_44_27]KKT63704.1 MAG: mannosyltransferase B-like protein [Candidatus Collierbacteria